MRQPGLSRETQSTEWAGASGSPRLAGFLLFRQHHLRSVPEPGLRGPSGLGNRE